MVGAVTRLAGLVTHCVDGDIVMARRGDSWATDACLPEHWRDVREWSIEKRQNHRVRPPLTSEPALSLSVLTHSGLNDVWSCFLGTVFAAVCCFLPVQSILSHLDSLLCVPCTAPLIVQQINQCHCSFTYLSTVQHLLYNISIKCLHI